MNGDIDEDKEYYTQAQKGGYVDKWLLFIIINIFL